MNLELKHIAGYLPYKLPIKIRHEEQISRDEWKLFEYDNFLNGAFIEMDLKNITPILRQLSDLTNDTYDFIYNKECDYPSIKDWINLDAESRLLCKFSYEFWQMLYSYNFDIHGLIEKGLAIDINTLSKIQNNK